MYISSHTCVLWARMLILRLPTGTLEIYSNCWYFLVWLSHRLVRSSDIYLSIHRHSSVKCKQPWKIYVIIIIFYHIWPWWLPYQGDSSLLNKKDHVEFLIVPNCRWHASETNEYLKEFYNESHEPVDDWTRIRSKDQTLQFNDFAQAP